MLKKRDTAILLVALVVILVSVRPSRKFEMKPTWRIAIDRENYANNLFPEEADKIPPPVLIDLDGDGINEIIFTNNKGVVNIYDASDSSKINVIPDYLGSNAAAIPELSIKSALSTLRPYGGFSGRRPVAVAAGYIDEPREGITRKPVIVIVTDGWNVMCFDHTLKLMWETTTRLDMTTAFFHKEIAISITPTPLRFEDRGLIVISARLSALNTDPLGHEHFSTDNQANPIDLIEGDEIEFKNDEKINLRGFDGDDDDDDDTHLGRRKSDFASAEKDEGHLSYYAFEGHTGALRWKHEQGDFEDNSADAILKDVMGDEFDVASSFEMRANLADNIKHVGEMDWREFKPYVLKNLPHVWRSREDSKLSFDRFERRRSVGASEKTPGSWTTRDLGFSSDVMGRFLSMIGSNTFIDEPGINKKPPNVIVSHSLSGIEVIHLYSGRQLCSLDLAKLRTYDDINADGTLDQIEAFDRYTQKLTKNKVKKQRCFAVASSGVPAVENLWNGSICRLDNLQALRSLNFQDLISSPSENVKIATPAVIPTINGNRQRDSLFLVSTGRVTSYAPDGSLNWQTTTPSTWGGKTKKSKQQSLSLESAVFPSINPLSLDVNSFPSHVLAVGSSKFTVLETETGTIVYTGTIDSGVPVANPIIADWNSDGFNDILITTNTGIYGYELQISQSQLLFPILVITLLLIIVILSFLTHASPSLHGRR